MGTTTGTAGARISVGDIGSLHYVDSAGTTTSYIDARDQDIVIGANGVNQLSISPTTFVVHLAATATATKFLKADVTGNITSVELPISSPGDGLSLNGNAIKIGGSLTAAANIALNGFTFAFGQDYVFAPQSFILNKNTGTGHPYFTATPTSLISDNLSGSGTRLVSASSTGAILATTDTKECFVTDTDVITAITGATYNSGNNYTVIISPASLKIFTQGQMYATAGKLYVAVSDNLSMRLTAS